MNDRCVSLLDNYEIEVYRTWKGRGAMLCETKQGTLIFKEYAGYKEKSVFQDALLSMIQNNGFHHVESIVRNKEGELLTSDQDGTCYVLKTYFEGRECNVRDMEECTYAMKTLARLHKASAADDTLPASGSCYTAEKEFEKHNKELRRVRKFLKEKSQKTDFEIYLMKCYDYFFNLALQITEEYRFYGSREKESCANKQLTVCHGDFQHHNLIFTGKELNIINFEKCMQDSPVRDIYLFMRKLLEKSGWSRSTGFDLLEAYESGHRLEKEDYIQLYYRLAYPEKFWKIVNFYYNSGKAWIPGKNLEKLEKITTQEKEKIEFLKLYQEKYGLAQVQYQ